MARTTSSGVRPLLCPATEGEVRKSSAYQSKSWLKRYADYVPKELPLPEKCMADVSEKSVERVPDHDAVRYFDHTISYGELND